MKSSFGRSFFTAAAILLVAMTILGASFQIKVNQFLTDTTVSGLQQNADTIAELAEKMGVPQESLVKTMETTTGSAPRAGTRSSSRRPRHWLPLTSPPITPSTARCSRKTRWAA